MQDRMMENIPAQVLHFSMKNVLACIDLKNIKQVISLPLLDPVPGCEKYLAGILNIEGKSVPVIDLGMKLNLKVTEPYTIDTPVILCEYNTHQVGLIVSKIHGLSPVEKDKFQIQDKLEKNPVYLGTVVYADKLSLLIDMAKLIEDKVT